MIPDLVFGLGMVAVVEGLVLALMPGRLTAMLERMRAIEPDRLRLVGLATIMLGVALVWMGRG